MGDLNVCIGKNDFINRRHTVAERELAKHILNNNDVLNIQDAFRFKVSEGGFTWTRGECFSRLDYVFVSETVLRYIVDCSVDWAFCNSDHAAVRIDLCIPVERTTGPGITKVNTNILKDPVWFKKVEEGIKFMLAQVPAEWNPHLRMEYVKVIIRSVFAEVAGEFKKEKVKQDSMIEGELNLLLELKQKLLLNVNINSAEKSRRTLNLDNAIDMIKIRIKAEQTLYTEELAFKARVKWFEQGEKSNKYFLGLLKTRQNQTYMSKIICDGTLFNGFEEIKAAVRNFYNNLYTNVVRNVSDLDKLDFFKLCPKLSESQKKFVDNELSTEELKAALKSCNETSPGPDGIPYIVYKSFWNILSPFLLESWKYSLETGKLTNSNLESIITLIPKQGKDASDIKNWRPITLSNCDSKIITKAIALRISKVLDSIIDTSQTAYVPKRNVMDNLRCNFLMKNYCSKNNINAVLLSLDAKKAFDSVSHDYITEVLEVYGFGIDLLKVLGFFIETSPLE